MMRRLYPYLLSDKGAEKVIEPTESDDTFMSILAISSLAVSWIALAIHWLSLYTTDALIVTLTLAIFAMVTGALSSFGLFKRHYWAPTILGRYHAGLYGFLLGLSAMIISLVMWGLTKIL